MKVESSELETKEMEPGVADTGSLEKFRQRQGQVVELFKRFGKDEVTCRTAFVFENEELDFKTVFEPTLKGLSENPLPDFEMSIFFICYDFLVRLVRYLFKCDTFSKDIMAEISKIPLWLTEGESLRTYWSENHTIMFTSTSYLLRQKFGQNAVKPADESLEDRLIWFLKNKIDHGFFEYFSNVYSIYTLSALFNLFDYATNPVIQSLAKEAIDRCLSDWVLGTNKLGINFSASGRSEIKSYLLSGNLYTSKVFQMLSLLTGFNFIKLLKTKPKKIYSLILFLADTKYDPSSVLSKYLPAINHVTQIGENKKTLFKQLVFKPDRYTSQMSQGGYAHPLYIEDTFRNISFYNLWSHSAFKQYKFSKRVPKTILKLFSKIGSSLTEGSLVKISSLKIWKHNLSTLSCVEDYYPGYKGYQQVVWAAGCDDICVLATSTDTGRIRSYEDIDKNQMNNHLPKIKQTENMAIILYNPNRDLSLLGIKRLEVVLHFNETEFDVVKTEVLQPKCKFWYFGKKNDSYIGVYVYCKDFRKVGNLKAGFSKKQMYVTIVGDKSLYKSFENFCHIIKTESKITTIESVTGIKGTCSFDGKMVSCNFTTNLGNVYKIMCSICVIVIVACIVLI